MQPETLVLETVNWIPGTERSWFAVSANGTAVSVPGNPDRRHLVWVDRQGAVTEMSGDPEQTTHAALSRDGRRVVFNGRNSQWVRDLVTGTQDAHFVGPAVVDRRLAAGRRTHRHQLEQDRRLGSLYASHRAAAS